MMREDEDYISNEDIKEIGEEKMKNETLKIVSFPEVVVEEKSEKQKTLFG